MYNQERYKGCMSNSLGRNQDASLATRPSRVLLVDDQEEIRCILNYMLSADGCEVSEARNGAEGLQQLLSEPYDLVVTDINMLVKDGLAMIEEA